MELLDAHYWAAPALVKRNSGIHVEIESAVGIDVLPDQRRDGPPIDRAESVFPVRPGQYLLQHQCVDVDHAVLQQVQAQHADFLILAPVAREFAALGKEDEIIGAIPLLDDVQAFVNFPAQRLRLQVTAEKDRLDRLAEFDEGKLPIDRIARSIHPATR